MLSQIQKGKHMVAHQVVKVNMPEYIKYLQGHGWALSPYVSEDKPFYMILSSLVFFPDEWQVTLNDGNQFSFVLPVRCVVSVFNPSDVILDDTATTETSTTSDGVTRVDSVSLSQLIDKTYELSGVDYSRDPLQFVNSYYGIQDANVLNFVLDGKTYSCIEDARDGYRSSMFDLLITEYQVENVFTPITVNAKMRVVDDGYEHDVVDFYDVKNGKLVLSIGTSYIDDYYPVWVAAFDPRNMSTNDDNQSAWDK